MPVSAEGRVEHQNLNQTAALLSFGWVFGFQLDSPEKNVFTLAGFTFSSAVVWLSFWCSTRLLMSVKKCLSYRGKTCRGIKLFQNFKKADFRFWSWKYQNQWFTNLTIRYPNLRVGIFIKFQWVGKTRSQALKIPESESYSRVSQIDIFQESESRVDW